MNATIPSASLLVPIEDDAQEEFCSAGLKLVRAGNVEFRSKSAVEEGLGSDTSGYSFGRRSGWVSSGPFLVASSSKASRTGLDLGLSMAHSETGLNETGTSEILTGGAASYSLASTEFAGYESAGNWQRSARTPHQTAQLPSSLFRYRVVKRIGDLILVALLTPFLLPVLLILAVLVKLTSAGPIFFSHRRICKNGAFFSMWKFRTMCINSSEVLENYLAAHPAARTEWNQTHKLQDDPRVTRVGRVMRRLSLDELPQIWNVVTGRMSLVGPRPIVAAEVEKYAECYHCYARVKPGVTGLWQVSGRSKLSYDARVKLDCEYVTHWSLLRDLKILALTIKSVVNQDGAY